ncbi:MAG: aromatic ring-hydroxylating dioxygenase subunit alpha [Rhodospirillaceae bacterium]|nr:aromatic ring-hydroxylating dioxygenase subunit alpha [Rhodospirillaceae bacterium]
MPHDTEQLAQLKLDLKHIVTLPDSAGIALPPAAYALPEAFELEVERIFRHEWVCLGRVDEVAKPGDYFTTKLVGEPLIVVMGDDRKIRVLSNICRHRWCEVASGKGNTRGFVCPYHAWTYRPDGTLVSARFMDRTDGFDRKDIALPAIRSEIWGGFIFATLDENATPLSERLTKLDAAIERYHMQDMQRFTGDDETWDTNWKLLVENFTEGYHTFYTHAESLQNSTPSELTYWGHDEAAFSAFYSPIAPEEPAREPSHPDLTDKERKTVFMICLYPSLVIALAPDRVFYMAISPIETGRVLTRWGVASYGEEFTNSSRKKISAFYDLVNQEDRVRLESIQRAVGSSYANTRSRRSWLERTNIHFGRYVASKLAS